MLNTPTPIFSLLPEWLNLRTKINSLSDGPETDALYVQWYEIEERLLALPCIGPADFAAKVVVIEDLSFEEHDDRVKDGAVALVVAHMDRS